MARLAKGVEITAPTSQTDLQRFQDREAGKDVDPTHEAVDYTVEGNDLEGYIGVDSMYQTYGDETQKPSLAEKGPEKVTEQAFLDALAVPKAGTVTGTNEDDEEVTAERSEPDTAPVTVPTPSNPTPNPAKD